MIDIILGKDDASMLGIDPSRTVFWTGAGISNKEPSCLPLGNGLTDAYLEAALGDKWKDFVALWNNYFPQIRESVKDGKWTCPAPVGNYDRDAVDNGTAWERPRLEYIIGEMDKLDKYFSSVKFHKPENQAMFKRDSSLAALRNFRVEPCLYHYRLADLSRSGATMVTANFDDGIERALGTDAEKVTESFNTKAIENGCGGYIYHFHGIATDDPNSFGATINSMSKGLDESFQKHLTECFEKGYDIVFIGYGGVDFFDVEPFFKLLSGRSFPGKAIYLHWCPDVTKREETRKKEKKYRYLLDPFQHQYIAYGDTDEFFQTIWHSYTSVTTPDHDCGAFSATTDALKKIVDEQVSSETYHFINMFRLCSQLNINPGRFYDDWIKRICDLFQIWLDDGHDTLHRMSVVDDQKNDGIIDDIYNNNWNDNELKSSGLSVKLHPYMNAWELKHQTIMMKYNRVFRGFGCPLPKRVIQENVDKTIDILKNKKTDIDSTDISRGTVMYLCGWQTKAAIGCYRVSNGLIKGRMLFIKKCIEDLLQFPFTRFRYRTHYLSLCRQLAYINLVLHKGKNGYEGNIQAEWDICMQTPNLFDAGQVINARLHEAKLYGFSVGVDELREIRQRILDLRGKSD